MNNKCFFFLFLCCVRAVYGAASAPEESVISPITGITLTRDQWATSVAIAKPPINPILSALTPFGHSVVLFEGYSGTPKHYWLHGISFGEARIPIIADDPEAPPIPFEHLVKEVGKFLPEHITHEFASSIHAAKHGATMPVFKFWDAESAKSRIIDEGLYEVIFKKDVPRINIQIAQDVVMFHKRTILRSGYSPADYVAVYFNGLRDVLDKERKRLADSCREAEEALRHATALPSDSADKVGKFFESIGRAVGIRPSIADLYENYNVANESLRALDSKRTVNIKHYSLDVEGNDSILAVNTARPIIVRITNSEGKLSVKEISRENLEELTKRSSVLPNTIIVDPLRAKHFEHWLREDVGILDNNWPNLITEYDGVRKTKRERIAMLDASKEGMLLPIRKEPDNLFYPLLYDMFGGRGRLDNTRFSFNCVTYCDLILYAVIPDYPGNLLVESLRISLEDHKNLIRAALGSTVPAVLHNLTTHNIALIRSLPTPERFRILLKEHYK